MQHLLSIGLEHVERRDLGPTYLQAELECKKEDDDNLELAESRLSSMESSLLLALLHASELRWYGGRSWTGREADFNTMAEHAFVLHVSTEVGLLEVFCVPFTWTTHDRFAGQLASCI